MPRPSLTLRTFVAMLAAALPPLVLLLLVDLANPGLRDQAAFTIAALGVVGACIAWAAIVAVLLSRVIGNELREMVHIAERGQPQATSAADGTTEVPGSRSGRLSQALDERNRQVAGLAVEFSAVPISSGPGRVAHHVIAAARSITGDSTWDLAVLDSDAPKTLVSGVYDGDALHDPAPLDDLHRWASVAGGAGGSERVAHTSGPWGAFVTVAVAAHDQLRAVMLAPWEGRPDPSAVDVALFNVIGQHAETAIEHALLYARVREQAEELDRVSAVQRDFLRAVSHDLQTPLTRIRAMAGELRTSTGLAPQLRMDLDVIEHQADRLRRMVQQLLAMSRLEAGVLQPRADVINPRHIIERTWDALRADDRQMTLEVSGQPMLLVADPDRVEQVLWAVLDNAVKYSPPGTPLDILLDQRMHGASPCAAIVIRDRGAGMDAESLGRAFEPFYRSEHAQRMAPDGTGIGLYTSRGLVEAMGGSLEIASQLGTGTTVTIKLPAEPIEAPDDEGTGLVPGATQG